MSLPTPEATLDLYADAMAITTTGALPQVIAGTSREIIVLVLANDRPDGLEHMLAGALARLIVEHGNPSWLTFAAETWVSVMPANEADRAPGSLERRAKAGDTTVTEAVMLLGVAANGERWNGIRPFHRSPLGITWDGPLNANGGFSGDIVDIMQRATR